VVTGSSSSDPLVGSAPRPAYYGGRGADSYLKRRRRGPWKMIGAVLAVLVVLGAVGAVGYVLGRRSVEGSTVSSGGASSTVAGATTVGPSTTPAVPTATTRPEIYIVKAGDSLAKIAKKFNTTIAALVELNGIANPDRLIEGTTLKIPPPNPPTTVPAPTAAAPPPS
jgi:LysM repeat protein